MEIEAKVTPAITLNVPHWFKQKDFMEWLNSLENEFTYHVKGEPASDWSDTIVQVDPGLSGEGSHDNVMPDKYWHAIVDICRQHFRPSNGNHILVKLTNLQE